MSHLQGFQEPSRPAPSGGGTGPVWAARRDVPPEYGVENGGKSGLVEDRPDQHDLSRDTKVTVSSGTWTVRLDVTSRRWPFTLCPSSPNPQPQSGRERDRDESPGDA